MKKYIKFNQAIKASSDLEGSLTFPKGSIFKVVSIDNACFDYNTALISDFDDNYFYIYKHDLEDNTTAIENYEYFGAWQQRNQSRA